MDDKEREYELKITLEISEVADFRISETGLYFICNLCGARLMRNYIGMPINERMLDHFEQTHNHAGNLTD